MANAITLLDPEKVILGGGVINGGRMVIDGIRRVVRENLTGEIVDNVQIVPAGLGQKSGVIGAVGIVLQKRRIFGTTGE